MSCNELSFENMSADATPVVVVVAASTGDGDPPDNAAKFYVDLRSVWHCPVFFKVWFRQCGHASIEWSTDGL